MNFARLVRRFIPQAVRYRMIRERYPIDEQEIQDVEVRVASTVDEYVEAARLLHDGYVGRGIMPSHGSGVRMTPHLALPSTVVFVAYFKGRLVATTSMVLDSALGLPMEKIYPQEVAALRAQGRKLAECGAQCVAKEFRGTGVAFLLNKAILHTAEQLGLNELMIALHPDAQDVYGAMLGFVKMGPERVYPMLNRSARAVALRMSGGVGLLQRTFGHLPRTSTNPYTMYCERAHPQLRLPSSAEAVRPRDVVHRMAAMKLAALRPDIVMNLESSEFETLRKEMQREASPLEQVVIPRSPVAA